MLKSKLLLKKTLGVYNYKITINLNVNFWDVLEIHKITFISSFSIYMTVPSSVRLQIKRLWLRIPFRTILLGNALFSNKVFLENITVLSLLFMKKSVVLFGSCDT